MARIKQVLRAAATRISPVRSSSPLSSHKSKSKSPSEQKISSAKSKSAEQKHNFSSSSVLPLVPRLPTRPLLTHSNSSSARRAAQRQRKTQGQLALREIRKYQKSTNLLIPKASFYKLLKEILMVEASKWHRWQSEAVYAMQEAAEDYLVKILEDADLCRLHRNRVTLALKDLQLAVTLQPRPQGKK